MSIRLLSLCSFAGMLAIASALGPPTGHEAPVHPAHWSYEGEASPEHWSDLDPSFEECSLGQQQSPIDLAGAVSHDLEDLDFHYQPSRLLLLNNGHTVQANVEPGSHMDVDGVRYDVVQFHYHAPSEHTLGGRSFPVELHIVHMSAEGKLAVVGLLVEQGEEHPALPALVSQLPAEEGPVKDAGMQINAADFLPATRATFRYDGSLTTPPCSEGVRWFVMATPIQASAGQIAAFEKVFKGNNRPVQPLHQRTVVEDSTP